MNQTAVIYDRASDIGQKDNWSRQDARLKEGLNNFVIAGLSSGKERGENVQ